MGRCIFDKDCPIRIKLSKNGVIHAAYDGKAGGYTYYKAGGEREYVPVRNAVYTVCKHHEIKNAKEHTMSNTFKITCKNCAKALGLIDPKINDRRFVLVRKDTGEFYKHTRYGCNWVELIYEATLYKTKIAAQHNGQRRAYYFNGIEMSKEEVKQTKEKGIRWYPQPGRVGSSRVPQEYIYKGVFNSDKYKINTVKIVVEETK